MAHNHSHAPDVGEMASSNRRRLAVALGITLTILVAQAIGAVWTGSLALLADTAHVFIDATGLIVAFVAAVLMQRGATAKPARGWQRVEVVAAAAQALLLIGVALYVGVAGALRLGQPAELPGGDILIFGVIGLVGNIISGFVLFSARNSNLNMKAAFLEVVVDAAGSVGVILSALALVYLDWQWVDTAVAIAIAVAILPRSWALLRGSMRVLMEYVPRDLDLAEITEHLCQIDHVVEVHDLHVSQISSGLVVLTAHVVIEDECFSSAHSQQILAELQNCVETHFPVPVQHSTFQLETAAHAASESDQYHLPL